MNTSHLEYFVTIVESDFNLTVAAKKLFISQPALSNFIVRFEQLEGIEVFIRRNGRNIALTAAGELLYQNAKEILALYNQTMDSIHELARFPSGSIRIGIPPLVLSVLFTKVLSKLISINPNIKFEVVENGAHELTSKLEQETIDIAIILHPHEVNLKYYHEIVLFEDNLMGYVNQQHHLAHLNRPLKWSDIKTCELVTFNDHFLIRHHLNHKFEELNIAPKIISESSSWDFLLEMVRYSDVLTILPRPLEKFINHSNIQCVPFENPIPWKVIMLIPKKKHYTLIELYILQSMFEYFNTGQLVDSINDFKGKNTQTSTSDFFENFK
ncbi:LysR family transcriptional regulator [Atopobacter phocae]|uniref:LysR family transcriptional regulator n=1 Tax=Atopobacter phocae TaxID=136492 RepID=UPI00047114E4|nr:LysR family transcriptional regulator [Atopobacter phocae]